MTALFGLAMVVIGSTVDIDGSGANLVVTLADRLEQPLGPVGRWLFLLGTLGAVWSSLLGVWQSVPYLFADTWQLLGGRSGPIDTRGWVYRGHLVALATLPAVGLLVGFARVQKVYAVAGALFMPLLALVLLVLNGRRAWIGAAKNGWLATLTLVATLAFFAWLAVREWTGG